MGRRSQHTPEELRKLIVDAAQDLVEVGGVTQVSAREIARSIGYAPGTLYNKYRNLDEILLHVQVRLLARLTAELTRCLEGTAGIDAVRNFASSYVGFAHQNARLWSLLVEHSPAPGTAIPPWFTEAFEAPARLLAPPLAQLMDAKEDEKSVQRTNRTLLLLIHALTGVSISTKLAVMSADAAMAFVGEAVEIFLSGLAPRGARRAAAGRSTRERSAASR